jgi:hypothetical protein
VIFKEIHDIKRRSNTLPLFEDILRVSQKGLHSSQAQGCTGLNSFEKLSLRKRASLGFPAHTEPCRELLSQDLFYCPLPCRHSEAIVARFQGGIWPLLQLVADLGVILGMLVLHLCRMKKL